MSKELLALDKLFSLTINGEQSREEIVNIYRELVVPIETALKRLNAYENVVGIERIQDTNKKLKALEIIKEIVKKDEETDFMSLFGNGMVNVGNTYEEIEEKYNLLKEVLK